jgi:hypothetical protein
MSIRIQELARDIDQLINLDMNRRGVIRQLYSAAQARIAQPLVFAAAQALTKALSPKSVVFIATGWPDRPWVTPKIGELDGPPGAALLARSIHQVLGAIPIFLIEEELITAMTATAVAAGFAVLTSEQALKAAESVAPLHATSVLNFPTDTDQAQIKAKELLSQYHPKALIVTEKGSANSKGVIHNARGVDTTACMAKIDEAVKIFQEDNIVTIGVGDGGNEVGMGLIKDTVREVVPYGAKCACPCQAGLAPEVATDVLVTASVSNWGCYGIAACLAALHNQPGALHDEAMERRTLREAADSGLIDGNTGFIDPGADGIPATSHAAIITLLRQLIANAVSPSGLALEIEKQGSRLDTS